MKTIAELNLEGYYPVGHTYSYGEVLESLQRRVDDCRRKPDYPEIEGLVEFTYLDYAGDVTVGPFLQFKTLRELFVLLKTNRLSFNGTTFEM